MSSMQIGALPMTIAILKTRTRVRSSAAADRARIQMRGSAGRIRASVVAKYRKWSLSVVAKVHTNPVGGAAIATHRLMANSAVPIAPAILVNAIATRSMAVKRDVSGNRRAKRQMKIGIQASTARVRVDLRDHRQGPLT